jgi:hypothetical protein
VLVACRWMPTSVRGMRASQPLHAKRANSHVPHVCALSSSTYTMFVHLLAQVQAGFPEASYDGLSTTAPMSAIRGMSLWGPNHTERH